MSAIKYLVDTAGSNHAVLLHDYHDRAVFTVRPLLASGAPAQQYNIEIIEVGETVKAREAKPEILPCFCPQRHINHDGSFCLYWAEVEAHTIDTPDAASEWWGKLLMFLLRQKAAAATRFWPGAADERAHGPEAARFQVIAETKASHLGMSFAKAFRERRFSTISKNVGGQHRVRLLFDGRRLLSVSKDRTRVMTLRQRCKCDEGRKSGLPIAGCDEHDRTLAEIAIALDGWRVSEKDYFDSFKGLPFECCGTMDNCPLADLLNAAA